MSVENYVGGAIENFAGLFWQKFAHLSNDQKQEELGKFLRTIGKIREEFDCSHEEAVQIYDELYNFDEKIVSEQINEGKVNEKKYV